MAWLSSHFIIRLFPYLDYHESVILQKTRLQGLILIIKSTYQGWYHALGNLRVLDRVRFFNNTIEFIYELFAVLFELEQVSQSPSFRVLYVLILTTLVEIWVMGLGVIPKQPMPWVIWIIVVANTNFEMNTTYLFVRYNSPMSLNPVVYLEPNLKKTRVGGLRCHVETMMNTEACEAFSWTPSLGSFFL
jgi:hypothetical protein